MSTNDKPVFEGTERELTSMTNDLDALHNDVGMPAMRAGISEMIENMKGGVGPTSRRTFLMGAGAIAAGGAALMTVGAPAMAGASTRRVASVKGLSAAAFPPAGLTGDLAVAAVAASLENLAVFAYSAGLGCRHRRQARCGAPGRGHLCHDGQGTAHPARRGVERRAVVQRQGKGHRHQPDADPHRAGRLLPR